MIDPAQLDAVSMIKPKVTSYQLAELFNGGLMYHRNRVKLPCGKIVLKSELHLWMNVINNPDCNSAINHQGDYDDIHLTDGSSHSSSAE